MDAMTGLTFFAINISLHMMSEAREDPPGESILNTMAFTDLLSRNFFNSFTKSEDPILPSPPFVPTISPFRCFNYEIEENFSFDYSS